MKQGLARCWYQGCPWLFLLVPVSLVFGLLVRVRHWAYRVGLIKSVRLAAPVIVVGNITLGGTGKTPVVIWLAQVLAEAGFRPGIISRGYGGAKTSPAFVPPDGAPEIYGDEPVLIAQRTACPVWVGRRRGEVGQHLLLAHPGVDVLISDDGLQHYALARDVELAILDGKRGLGNGHLLPAGPLREMPSRLDQVDAILVNGAQLPELSWCVPSFSMVLQAGKLYNLKHPEQSVSPDYFAGRVVSALAGIGHPERFFSTLSDLGIRHTDYPFPDHHVYAQSDLPQGTLLMTEKDAVKFADIAHNDMWALAVDARVPDGLQTLILNKLGRHHGQ